MVAGESWFPLLIRWLLLAVSVWIAAELLAGIELEGVASTLIVAAILGLLNAYVRPFLLLITLPVTVLTLGLFIIVINALMLGLADLLAGLFDINFEVKTFGAALLGALIISIVSTILNSLVQPGRFA